MSNINIEKKKYESLTLDELYQIMDLRNRVFIMEQRILYVDTDFYDQHSSHYFIKDQEKIICYLRVVRRGVKFEEYSITRVVTDPKFRNQKLATRLIKDALEDHKGYAIRISAQAYLKTYYESFGFKVVKGPYIEEDILHYEMLYGQV